MLVKIFQKITTIGFKKHIKILPIATTTYNEPIVNLWPFLSSRILFNMELWGPDGSKLLRLHNLYVCIRLAHLGLGSYPSPCCHSMPGYLWMCSPAFLFQNMSNQSQWNSVDLNAAIVHRLKTKKTYSQPVFLYWHQIRVYWS